MSGAQFLGAEQLEQQVFVRSYRTDDGIRLDFDDTGTFDIVDGGRTIWLTPKSGCNYDFLRADTLARVMGMANHTSGRLCLHGSAVAFASGVGVAFLAPKMHGKSTLASSLTMAGSRLMTDDNVLIELGAKPILWPGVHHVRLFVDSARYVGGGEAAGKQGADTKYVLSDLPDERLMLDPVPLAALYVLMPPKSPSGETVVRMPLPAVAAAMSILQHPRLGALLGASGSRVLLDRAVSLAERVPVYSLEFVRDYGRLDEVVAQLMEWHGQPADPPALAVVAP
jgi:hypothetical protein